MRAWLVLVAACTPEIASGSYLCGPEGYCPPDQVCSGSNNTCVLAGQEQAFACTDKYAEHEPDDTATQALAAPQLGCVSAPFIEKNCLHDGDPADWLKVTSPSGCTAVAIQVRATFPVAFEPVVLELWDLASNTMIAPSATCPAGSGIVAGDDGECLTATVMTSHDYGVAVKPAGGGDCGGTCAHNRYDLSVQFATP